jgi:uncharacterized protein YggE
MKQIFGSLFLLLMLPAAMLAQPWSGPNTRSITVSGEAVVYASPDRIIVTIGIETWDKNLLAAKAKNNDLLDHAVSVAQNAGVRKQDIETDQLSITPRYKEEYAKEEFIGYFVRNSIVLTLNDAARVDGLITAMLQAGITTIHGVDFQTTDYKALRERAREMALKAAKEKAEHMAGALGQKIGAPVSITENWAGSPWYWSPWGGSGRNRSMTQNVAQDVRSGGGEIGETVAPGKISIRANVTVIFELH